MLGLGGFTPDDIVPFYDRCNSHSRRSIFHTIFYPDNFPQSPYQDLRAMGDFGWEGKSNVQLRPSLQILINHKIKATCRDITRFAFLRAGDTLGGYAYDYGRRKAVSPGVR